MVNAAVAATPLRKPRRVIFCFSTIDFLKYM
jgi:hypothetical protein